ncbi:MAG: PAAR domain-containing protein [Candidatus Amoebophilus sp.]|uniref:PAAR repeat-containing protein n=1 Tax=Amoebophilus asiaticus (strain 5a2) TaxID=452471 RepID=B3ET74_AMOA5|nr:PAAR domain-containing protein [Candidatus Amoebophilus asiaticus]ACE06426.1 hypothetical protein Aasi_1081 [Candidatus Amoebophilus asiaticus 5a2]
MPGAATITHKHICPLVTPGLPPIPHAAGGVIIKGCPTVMINGLPAARVTDMLQCAGPPPHPDTIVMGSTTVLIGGLPAARMGSLTAVGGTVQMGSPTVMIGG